MLKRHVSCVVAALFMQIYKHDMSTHTHTHKHTHTQTDRQTDRHDRQTDKTDRQTDRQSVRQTDRQTHTHTPTHRTRTSSDDSLLSALHKVLAVPICCSDIESEAEHARGQDVANA